MSLLTPEKLSVKVYRWDDEGAPILDNPSTLFKACLVTGYGDKTGAGWSLLHEDLDTHSKVFATSDKRMPEGMAIRVYNDNGQKLNIQLAKDVTDANIATSVVECDTAFKYLGSIATGEWMLIASESAFWFFMQVKANGKNPNQSGAFLFAGIVPGTSTNAFILKHTGGSWSDTDDDRYGITSTLEAAAAAEAVACNLTTLAIAKANLSFITDGNSNQSDVVIASPLYFVGGGDVYQLPIFSPSRNDLLNFAPVNNSTERQMINFCTSMQYRDIINNAYVYVDYWN